MKIPVIELFEFNFFMSLMSYFITEFKDQSINGKKLVVSSASSDQNLPYNSNALSIDILYRKNRSIGFGNYYGDIDTDDYIIEIEGLLFEYRVQLNVYSNTRGEGYKWNSILDEVLRKGSEGIPINTYLDNGTIKQSKVGSVDYDFAQDIKNNPMNPNIQTYDYHTIYEIKMKALQKYTIRYDYMELGDIIGKLKSL